MFIFSEFSHEGCFGGGRAHYDLPTSGMFSWLSSFSENPEADAAIPEPVKHKHRKHKVRPERQKRQSSMQKDLAKTIEARRLRSVQPGWHPWQTTTSAVAASSGSEKRASRPGSRSSMMWWDEDDKEEADFEDEPGFIDFDGFGPSASYQEGNRSIDLSECTLAASDMSDVDSFHTNTYSSTCELNHDSRTKIKSFNPSASRSSIYESGIRSMTNESRTEQDMDGYSTDASESTVVGSMQKKVKSVDHYVSEKLVAFEDARAKQKDDFLQKLLRQNFLLKKNNKQLKQKLGKDSTGEYEIDINANESKSERVRQAKMNNLRNEVLAFKGSESAMCGTTRPLGSYQNYAGV